jgi:hypothetical protein
VDGPFVGTASLLVGQGVPLDVKLEGKLTTGKDTSAKLRFQAPLATAPLRIVLRHTPLGAKGPVISVTEMLLPVGKPGDKP